MARKGRAGPALAAAGLGSFYAGCVGTLILAAFAPRLTELAFKFGPAEYSNLALPEEHREVFTAKDEGLWPTKQDFKDMTPEVLRGTFLGSALGILPGGGALLASFAAYALEKKLPAKPGEVPFGQGNIRGVASPESANNAGAQTSFIPLQTLGIPPNAVMALMVGAMTIHNIQPGPQVMTSNPELFWGLIASMWVGNAMLIVLNLPLIGMWIKLLTVPYRWLFPAIVLFCTIGVYTTNNATFDIWLVAAFGFVGYTFNKLGMEPSPMMLSFILGPMMEENLRRARGDWSVFITRGLSAGLLVAAALMLVVGIAAQHQEKARGDFRRGLAALFTPGQRHLRAPLLFLARPWPYGGSIERSKRLRVRGISWPRWPPVLRLSWR